MAAATSPLLPAKKNDLRRCGMGLLASLLCCSLATIVSGHDINMASVSAETSHQVRSLGAALARTPAAANTRDATSRHISDNWAINHTERDLHRRGHYLGDSAAFGSAVSPAALSSRRGSSRGSSSSSSRSGFCVKSSANVYRRSQGTVRVEEAPHHAASMMEKERDVGRRRGNGAAMMEEETGLRWDGDADEVGVGFGVVQNPCKVKLGRNALEVCRVINGLSQESLDDATNDLTPALRAMDRLAEEGFTTFQLGNGMGGGRALAERRAGAYLKSAAGAASGSPEVRFLNTLSLRPGVPVTRRAVKDAVERSLRRMGVDRLDLVQLCWRDFEDRYFLDALCYLEESEWVSNVGVCGFRAAPLALAQKNGLTIASNLVSSSLITAPVGGEETLRQCNEQGVAIISSGASLGGLAANEWLYRSEPADWKLDTATLDFRQALSDVGAWGSTHKDPWHLYQTELLPELETVARKHGRGLYPADVATAFHLHSSSSNRKTNNNGSTMMSDGPTSTASSPCTQNEVAAIVVPVRVCCEGKTSIKAAEGEEAKTVGRRGAELAAMLDEEDLERLALAVGKGSVMREEASAGRLCWEEALLGGEEEDRDEEEGERGGLGWDVPLLFL